MDFYEERDGSLDLLWLHALFRKRGSRLHGDFLGQNSKKRKCMSRESKSVGRDDNCGGESSGRDGRIETEG
jgi:hypothetical protein